VDQGYIGALKMSNANLPGGDRPAATIGSDRDRLLFALAAELTSSLDLDIVLNRTMDQVIELMNAARGFIVLVDPAGTLEVRTSRNETSETEQREFLGSKAVIEKVVATGQAVLATDATADDRFKGRDSVILQNLRSIVAVPLIAQGQVMGAVYCDNPFRSGIFGEQDKEFLQAIAHQAAIAIENARLYTELKSELRESDRLRATFERYVNKQVMERVLAEPEGGFLAGERLRVTMLATDIAGFSTLSRELAAEDLVRLLNDYFRGVVDIVIDHGGNIDKFQGDGLLAVFGAPVPLADSPHRAVAATRALIKHLAHFNRRRAQAGRAPLEVGMGLDTGSVVAGNVGTDRRLEYTLIGVPVNNAAYLSKMRPAAVLLSHNTFEELGGTESAVERAPIALKGTTRKFPIYQL
jgi:adenylate cyclase